MNYIFKSLLTAAFDMLYPNVGFKRLGTGKKKDLYSDFHARIRTSYL